MKNFEVLNLLYCCLFTMFVFYQQLHLRDFRGASKTFELVLSVFAFSGMIVGLIYLIIYGIKVIWWAPLVVFIISLAFQFIAFSVERLVGMFSISLIGFIGWPLFAFLMFITIPSNKDNDNRKNNTDHLFQSIVLSNQATRISNQNAPFSIIPDDTINKIVDLKKKAYIEGLKVDIKLLEKDYKNFGKNYESYFLKGLETLIDGYETRNTNKIIMGNDLLDKWGTWYNDNLEKIKNK